MKRGLLFSACIAVFIVTPVFSQNIPHKIISDDALMPGTHNPEHNWSKRTREETDKQPTQVFDNNPSPVYKLNARQAYIQKYKNDNALVISKPMDLHAQPGRIKSGIFSPEYFLFTK